MTQLTIIKMDRALKESTLLRKSLLGIRVTPFTSAPLFFLNDWSVFDAGVVNTLPIEERNRNLNFQIQRGDHEKILVRIFFTTDKSIILKVNYYYMSAKTDAEQSGFLVCALINRIGKPAADDYQLNRFEF